MQLNFGIGDDAPNFVARGALPAFQKFHRLDNSHVLALRAQLRQLARPECCHGGMNEGFEGAQIVGILENQGRQFGAVNGAAFR